jgi:hypothetical protein
LVSGGSQELMCRSFPSKKRIVIIGITNNTMTPFQKERSDHCRLTFTVAPCLCIITAYLYCKTVQDQKKEIGDYQKRNDAK